MIWVILILGFILRLINLNQGLWLDEGTQALLSQESLQKIIFQRGADIHPPLSYILMHFWMAFGTSEIWLRLLSVIFGVATIWIIYKFSKDIFNKKIALLSSFLLAVSAYHIYYSQEIRMYSEAIFFASVSMYYFYLLTKKGTILNSLFYILSSVFLIYTHYIGIFLIAAQFLYLGFLKKNYFIFFLKRAFFILLLFLPWLPTFILQLSSGSDVDNYLPGWRNILSVSFYKVIPLTFFKFSMGRIDFNNKILYLFIAVFVLSLFLFVLLKGIKSNNSSKLIAFWLFLPLIIAILISFKIPLDQPHRLIYVLPAYYILLALGIFKLQRFQKVFFLGLTIVSISGLCLYYFNPKFWREDWRGATAMINSKCQSCSVIFAWPEPFAPFIWYKGDNGFGIVKKFPATYIEIDQNISKIDVRRQIFLFEYLADLSDPNRLIQKYLEDHNFIKTNIYDFRGVGFIYEYSKE